jgi:glucosamine-6-phosphate deaminase
VEALIRWPVRIETLRDAAAVSTCAADILCAATSLNAACWLGLPTGATPIPLYMELARRSASGGCRLEEVTACAIDEFCAPAASRGTNAAFYRDHLRFPLGSFRCPDAAAPSPQSEIEMLAGMIRARGGLDLCVLGVGRNGHIAFNEPGSPADASARVVDLAADTRAAHRAAFDGPVPMRGMTLGVSDLLASQAILVLATGARKAHIVKRAIAGPQTADVPATWLQHHADVTWLLDVAAASSL